MKNLIEQLKSLAANARKQAEGYVAQARSYALDKWKALQKRLVEQG